MFGKTNTKIPVYMINGFLESGKTDFISFTISQDYFRTGERTLLVLCEEGEQEYDPKTLKRTNTILEVIEDEEDFTVDALNYLVNKDKVSRVIIEYNGMWKHKDIKLPENWVVEQQITLIDASTFPMYYTNMRSMVADMVRGSEMIIFNRCDGVNDLANFKRNVKAVNPQADIIFEGKDGEINMTLDEDLPFDLNADVIELDNLGYGIWYIDMMDNPGRYEGKTISYVGQVLKPKTFPKDYFVPGRMAMTCCADDMAFLGFATHFEGCENFKEKSWVKVTAKIKNEYFADYEGAGPVLYATEVAVTKEPEKPVIDFSA
ncbi:MAG: GTPase [Lachnospiraceae bacterium]|nr:GTPase [Lachnospiraceae bacterium]